MHICQIHIEDTADKYSLVRSFIHLFRRQWKTPQDNLQNEKYDRRFFIYFFKFFLETLPQ